MWCSSSLTNYRGVGESSRPRQSHKLEIGGANPSPASSYGVWRSLVAHLVWDQGVQGSNPCTPTKVFKRGNSMTCRGYDSRAVKLPQAVKRAATLIRDAHKRGDFIRSFVEIEKSNSRSSGSRGDKK